MLNLWSPLIATILALPFVFASPNGTLGRTSEATSTIRIRVLSRIELKLAPPPSQRYLAKRSNTTLCLQTNKQMPEFSLHPASGKNSYSLRNKNNKAIPYGLFRNDRPIAGYPLRKTNISAREEDRCGKNSSAISVRFDESAMASSPAGTYSDTVLLYAEPI